MVGVAVVGADGTLGALVAHRLGARGVRLRSPDPRSDVAVPDVAGADVVVNVGGPRVRPGLRWADYFREHVGVTTAVVRAMRPGARLVHVSSTAVYGARGETLGAASREAPTLFPSAAYACAKLAAEAEARALAAERGVEVVVLRPSMVYGPGVDSALSTLRRLRRRRLRLHLAPLGVRQHLVHIDLFLAVVARATSAALGHVLEPLLVADPFVLTNADLTLAPGPGVSVPIDVRSASMVHKALARLFGGAPGGLGALAVLATDNVFDVAPTWRALGIDATSYGRRATFDAYWSGDG